MVYSRLMEQNTELLILNFILILTMKLLKTHIPITTIYREPMEDFMIMLQVWILLLEMKIMLLGF